MNLLIPEIIPSFSGVLKGQGVPKEAKIKKAIENDIYSALELFKTLATPGYLIEEISTITFDEIYNSSGMNEGDSPLELIYPKSEKLALFVITVGEKVTNKISKLMKENEIVIASMLDTVASLAVENSVEVLEKKYKDRWEYNDNKAVLGYSPGYCGWHLSVQHEIFRILQPEKINITLSESFLMDPIKSASGVLVGGPKEIHFFKNNFPFCSSCKGRTCVTRIKNIKE